MKRLAVIAALLGGAVWVGAWSWPGEGDDSTVAAAAKKKSKHADGGTRDQEEKEEDVRAR